MTMHANKYVFAAAQRRGITLLEVLIAIGILAVGLSSVVALIPAGRSQAARAVVLDRASNLAANALSDAATFGLLRPDSLTASSGFVVIDPLGLATFGTLSSMRQLGIFSGTATLAAGAAVHSLFARATDDVVFAPGATDDDLPLNEMLDGARGFQGRMSCIYGIQSGTPGRLSAVVFHARDPQTIPLSLALTDGVVTGVSPDLADVVKPSVVLWSATPTPRFHQVTSFTIVASTATAYFTFSSGTALLAGTHTVYVLPDSVGLAERTFTAEESGPYLQ
jgi:prepilin-type N-terminal cleavage/methylation domain-containing protein